MKGLKFIRLGVALAVSLLGVGLSAAEVAAAGVLVQAPKLKAPYVREAVEWLNVYAYNTTDERLPRVLLLGDSVCGCYSERVRDELAGSAYLSYCANSKCLTAPNYLGLLDFLLEEHQYAAIHFNNGLHSLKVDPQDWEACLRATVKLLKAKGRGAKLIWASSTPLRDGGDTAKVKALNAIAARVMKEEGIPADDLFSLLDPLDRQTAWIDNFHHTEATRQLLAKSVAACLRETLGLGKATPTAAKTALDAAHTATGPAGKL